MTIRKAIMRRNTFTRIVSILIIQAFLISNVSFALSAPSEAEKVTLARHEEAVASPDKVVIQRDFGLIKSKFTGNKRKLIVHIQDAHCNYEAQSNIINILEGLIKNYGLSLVSVEGADGIIDTSWFKAFPDEDVRKEVATYFMKKGEITGPEFLSITSNYPIKLFGAETRAYYIQNLNAFTSSYPLKEDTEKYYLSVKNALNRMKGYIYSEELKDLDAKMQDYESKKMQFNDYVRFLQDLAEKHKIALRGYDNLFKLVSVLIYEKKIDFNVTDKERNTLIDELSKKISKDALTDLVTQSLAFKVGKISSAEYYTYLKALAVKNEVDMAGEFPNLFNYIIYNSVYSRIENEKLFQDIKKLEGDIKEKLFANDDQRTLNRLSHHIDTLLGLVNIKLMNGDFDYYETHREEFSPEVFTAFLKNKTIQYGLAYDIEPPADAVAESIPKLEDFYRIAIKRDKALVDNTLDAMVKEGEDMAVLVTGGFHSEGIAKLLEKEGVSYLVICPNITKDVETPYIKILTNQRTPLEDILSDTGATAEPKSSMLAPPLVTQQIIRILRRGGVKTPNIVELRQDILGVERAVNIEDGWISLSLMHWLEKMMPKASTFAQRSPVTMREIYIDAMKQGIVNDRKAQLNKDKLSPEKISEINDLVKEIWADGNVQRWFDEVYDRYIKRLSATDAVVTLPSGRKTSKIVPRGDLQLSDPLPAELKLNPELYEWAIDSETGERIIQAKDNHSIFFVYRNGAWGVFSGGEPVVSNRRTDASVRNKTAGNAPFSNTTINSAIKPLVEDPNQHLIISGQGAADDERTRKYAALLDIVRRYVDRVKDERFKEILKSEHVSDEAANPFFIEAFTKDNIKKKMDKLRVVLVQPKDEVPGIRVPGILIRKEPSAPGFSATYGHYGVHSNRENHPWPDSIYIPWGALDKLLDQLSSVEGAKEKEEIEREIAALFVHELVEYTMVKDCFKEIVALEKLPSGFGDEAHYAAQLLEVEIAGPGTSDKSSQLGPPSKLDDFLHGLTNDYFEDMRKAQKSRTRGLIDEAKKAYAAIRGKEYENKGYQDSLKRLRKLKGDDSVAAVIEDVNAIDPSATGQVIMAMAFGKGDIFRFWDKMNLAQKLHFLHKLKSIDIEEAERFYKRLVKDGKDGAPVNIEDVKAPTQVKDARVRDGEYAKAGSVAEKLFRNGEIAFLELAGGRGARLGLPGPKILLKQSAVQNKTLAEMRAGEIRALSDRYGGKPIPWIIMTSYDTDKKIREFFESGIEKINGKRYYFGQVPEEWVHFIEQNSKPLATDDGEWFINDSSMEPYETPTGELRRNKTGEDRYEVVTGGFGHGDAVGKVLKDKETQKFLDNFGIKHVSLLNLDNAFLPDVACFGWHELMAKDVKQGEIHMSIIAVEKTDPEEKVGMSVLIGKDENYGMIEYNQIPVRYAYLKYTYELGGRRFVIFKDNSGKISILPVQDGSANDIEKFFATHYREKELEGVPEKGIEIDEKFYYKTEFDKWLKEHFLSVGRLPDGIAPLSFKGTEYSKNDLTSQAHLWLRVGSINQLIFSLEPFKNKQYPVRDLPVVDAGRMGKKAVDGFLPGSATWYATAEDKVKGHKFETMAFHVFFNNIVKGEFIIIDRDKGFAPIKNPDRLKVDSPSTAKSLYIKSDIKLLEQFDWTVSDDAVVELSPAFRNMIGESVKGSCKIEAAREGPKTQIYISGKDTKIKEGFYLLSGCIFKLIVGSEHLDYTKIRVGKNLKITADFIIKMEGNGEVIIDDDVIINKPVNIVLKNGESIHFKRSFTAENWENMVKERAQRLYDARKPQIPDEGELARVKREKDWFTAEEMLIEENPLATYERRSLQSGAIIQETPPPTISGQFQEVNSDQGTPGSGHPVPAAPQIMATQRPLPSFFLSLPGSDKFVWATLRGQPVIVNINNTSIYYTEKPDHTWAPPSGGEPVSTKPSASAQAQPAPAVPSAEEPAPIAPDNGAAPAAEAPYASAEIREIINKAIAEKARGLISRPDIAEKMAAELTALVTTVDSIVVNNANTDRKLVIIAYDTALDPGDGSTKLVAQAGEEYIKQRYGENKFIMLRDTGKDLADKIARARQDLQNLGGANIAVVTIAGDKTREVMETLAVESNSKLDVIAGTILNVHIDDPKQSYVPFAMLYNLAFKIAYDQIDDSTLSLMNYFFADGNKQPFISTDQLKQGIIRLLPRAGKIDPEEAREAYKAAAQALRSL